MILTPLSRIEALDQAARFAGGLRQRAKGEVLRGIIAIEAGNIVQAETLFRESIRLWISTAEAQSGAGLDFPGRRVAQDALEILRAGR
jgi:hypothetical protein